VTATPNDVPDRMPPQRRPNRALAFLLAQVGAHAGDQFAERLKPIALTPAQAGVMRIISRSAGLTQQALCLHLSVVPSRLVVLIDELESRELVERRKKPEDRRSHALHLTEKGETLFLKLRRIAQEHQDALCASLSTEERDLLATLLSRIAEEQGLTPGVHPGYQRPSVP
jgi:DNA-binding MarR family transcriptional regulator